MNPSGTTWDPMQFGASVPIRRVMHPLGFPLELETNSERVAACAARHWSLFREMFPASPLKLRVVVSEQPPATPLPPGVRGGGRLLVMASDSDNFAACDLESGEGVCFASEEAVSREAQFRYDYLESMVYAMLNYQRFATVHGAVVMLNRKTFLLEGESGAGKSCLAFHCARNGFTLISDDAGYIVRGDPQHTVVGNPRLLRFEAAAAEIFPELSAYEPSCDSQGRRKLEVEASDFPEIRTETHGQAPRAVFLERQTGSRASVETISGEAALRRLIAQVPRSSEAVNREQIKTLESMVAGGAYRLCYSGFEGVLKELRGLATN